MNGVCRKETHNEESSCRVHEPKKGGRKADKKKTNGEVGGLKGNFNCMKIK